MPLNLDGKKAVVAEVAAQAAIAQSCVIADSRGVAVNDMARLRQQARDNNVWLKVVRNTLARRAVAETSFAELADAFVGPSLVAFSLEHPGAGARILKEFAEENDKLELKTAMFEGEVTPIDLLASLPTYDEAVAKLMATMKEASAGKLVRTLAALRDQKEQEAA